MLKALRIPFDKNPMDYATIELEKLSDFRVCIVAPTSRNVRILAEKGVNNADFFTIKEFTAYANEVSGILIPKQLRPFYLQKAAKALAKKDKTTLFKNDENLLLEDYDAFLQISGTMFSFYRELASEMVDVKTLAAAGKYTDYENQITALTKLWEKYMLLIKTDGWSDEWEEFKNPKFRNYFIERYDEFIFLISGYLTKYELKQLKQVSSIKNITLLFNYAGNRYSLHRQYEKYLNIELSDRPLRQFNQNNCILVASSGMISQLEFITAEIFKQNTLGIGFEEMAVIIPEESVKNYFLRMDNYNLFDITANESIDSFQPYAFIKQVFEVAYEIKSSKKLIASIKNIQNLFRNPVIKKYIQTEKILEELTKLAEKIENGRLYLSLQEILEIPFLGEITKDIFQAPSLISPNETLKLMKNVFTFFLNSRHDDKVNLTKIIYKLDELSTYYSKIDDKINFAESAKLMINELSKLKQNVTKGKVPVMGILESRNLYFKIIFIPSMNENIFPPIAGKDLFLNTEIRKELGLPTFTDRENLIKNYLLQIMERTQISYILYTKTPNSKRRSRFVEELAVKNMLPEYSFAPDEIKLITSPRIFYPHKTPFIVEKDDNIINLLKNITFSATSFDDYISCSLRFYLKYIDKTITKSETEEKISDKNLGKAFHKALEIVYNNKIMPSSPDFKQILTDAYQKELEKLDAFKFNLVERFRSEQTKDNIIYIADEELKWEKKGYITIYREKKIPPVTFEKYKLKGTIDRIDEKDGQFYIIDYKFRNLVTSKSKTNFNTAINLQMPFYALLFEKKFKQVPANLYYFDLKKDFKFTQAFNMDEYDSFKEFAKNTLDTIVSPSTPFQQTQKQDRCGFCPYAPICGR